MCILNQSIVVDRRIYLSFLKEQTICLFVEIELVGVCSYSWLLILLIEKTFVELTSHPHQILAVTSHLRDELLIMVRGLCLALSMLSHMSYMKRRSFCDNTQ